MKNKFNPVSLADLGSLKTQLIQSTRLPAEDRQIGILAEEEDLQDVMRLFDAMLHFLPERALDAFKDNNVKLYLSNYFDKAAITKEICGVDSVADTTVDPLGSYYRTQKSAVVGIQSAIAKDKASLDLSRALLKAIDAKTGEEFFNSLKGPKGQPKPKKMLIQAGKIASLLEEGIQTGDRRKVVVGLTELSENPFLCRIVKTMVHELGHGYDNITRSQTSTGQYRLHRASSALTLLFSLTFGTHEAIPDGVDAQYHPMAHYLGLRKTGTERYMHMRKELFAETWAQTFLTRVTEKYGVKSVIPEDVRVEKAVPEYWEAYQGAWDKEYTIQTARNVAAMKAKKSAKPSGTEI